MKLKQNPLIEEWLAEKRTANTRRTYLTRLRNFLDYHKMSPKEFLDQTPRKHRTLLLRFQNEQPNMNPNTIISHLTAAASFLDYYDKTVNWKRSRVRPRPDVTSHVFSNGDLSKMFEIADTKQKCMLSLATSLGWEVRGFVTLKRKTLQDLIERAKDTGEKFVYFRNIRHKTGALRLGVLNPLALEWTSKWLEQSKNYEKKPRKPDRNNEIKPVSDVFDMTAAGINRMLKRLAKKAGIRTCGRVRFHNLRKWVMSGLSRSGFNEFQIKYVLGKAIPMTDGTYLQTLEIEVKERYPEAYENYMNLNPTVSPKAVMSLTKENEELKSRILRLETKFKGLGRIRDTSDLLMREILQDPRFERLLAEKVSEGLEVREDTKKGVKIHKIEEICRT